MFRKLQVSSLLVVTKGMGARVRVGMTAWETMSVLVLIKDLGHRRVVIVPRF